MNYFYQIFNNKSIIIPVLSWLVAQAIKIIRCAIEERRFKIDWIVGSGGMPSAHSSFIVSMATVIAQNYGWDSGEFGIAFSLALIVMYDATGVRRAAGKQAKVLNKIISSKGMNFDEKLKELIGHSPIEVLIGAILGLIMGITFG